MDAEEILDSSGCTTDITEEFRQSRYPDRSEDSTDHRISYHPQPDQRTELPGFDEEDSGTEHHEVGSDRDIVLVEHLEDAHTTEQNQPMYFRPCRVAFSASPVRQFR